MAKVLLTDFAWPDVSVEAATLAEAGHELVAGEATPAPSERIEELAAATKPDAIMTCWANVSAKAIAAAPGLRIVARMGVGLDNIDVAACTERGIWVTNVPDYCVEEVSDHALALLLDWTRQVSAFDASVKSGQWHPQGARLKRLANLTIGLVGFGKIARRTAAKLKPWDCRILVYNRSPIDDDAVEQVGFDQLLVNSDCVIVHVPLTDETHHLIDRRAFGLMKPGSFLINVSRGGVVDTAALIEALADGTLAGAGLDVLEDEASPPRALVDLPNVRVTPHVAFSSDASLYELRRSAALSVVSALADVNPPLNACNQAALSGKSTLAMET